MVKQTETTERTFVAIKPDGVQRAMVGEIMKRFEQRGLKLVALKMRRVTKEHAQKHYADLSKKPFFDDLCSFICSSPVVSMVWEGYQAVKTGRVLLGATNPQDSLPGTIRGDLAIDIGRNVIHASDSVESANKEIALWFTPEDIADWCPAAAGWVYELPVDKEKKACGPSSSSASASAGKKWTLEVSVDRANMKNSDKVERCDPMVKMVLGSQTLQSTMIKGTLTPEWMERFTFQVTDPQTEKLEVTVYLGKDEAGAGTLVLSELKQGSSTYKGVACKGGKLDMTLRAVDFGKTADAPAEENADWMEFM